MTDNAKKNFFEYIVTEKGEFILFTLPVLLSLFILILDPTLGLFEGLLLLIFSYVVICNLDVEYLKYLGYKDTENPTWTRFIPPVYLTNRSKLLGKKYQSVSTNSVNLIAGIISFLLVSWFVTYANNVEGRTCDSVTEIIQDQWGYTAECKSVTLEEIGKNEYVGTAYLDDGDSVSVTVHKTRDGQTEVAVLPF